MPTKETLGPARVPIAVAVPIVVSNATTTTKQSAPAVQHWAAVIARPTAMRAVPATAAAVATTDEAAIATATPSPMSGRRPYRNGRANGATATAAQDAHPATTAAPKIALRRILEKSLVFARALAPVSARRAGV